MIIRNDQTQELNTLHRELQTSKDTLLSEKQNHQVKVKQFLN